MLRTDRRTSDGAWARHWGCGVRRLMRVCGFVVLPLMAGIPATGWSQTPQKARPVGAEPTPEFAASAVLSAFRQYEVVAMPEAHGMKDLDDFILALIRHPAFAARVNDIVVECDNSLYQPELDRYIAREDVPFVTVRRTWRNTSQPMCGLSGFFEQLFPLIRALNQKLPPGRRLRVLAGNPLIDWERAKSAQEAFMDRDETIASVIEREVLAKHRKALMLFGAFHIMHGMGAAALNEKGAVRAIGPRGWVATQCCSN
jgi:hypothetical protein